MSDDRDSETEQETTNDDKNKNDVGKEAAGVIRGVSRSIVRSPLVGRLPVVRSGASKGLLRQRLPVRQVAKVSDRLSTGLDVFSSYGESGSAGGNGDSKEKKLARWTRIQSFAGTLLKNTLLGMAVFESYGYVIGTLAPQKDDEYLDVDENAQLLIDDVGDDNDSSQIFIQDEPDEYARAHLSAHFGAGCIAGSVHGVSSSFMDGSHFFKHRTYWLRYLALNTIHHTFAHSLLFGSYECIKRPLISMIRSLDQSTQYFDATYLISFGLAGGIAGQLQHIASHATEQVFGLANTTPTLKISSSRLSLPAFRPILSSFPPSAIGFVAFEYGKKLIDV